VNPELDSHGSFVSSYKKKEEAASRSFQTHHIKRQTVENSGLKELYSKDETFRFFRLST
jgi:hypothetical protein